MTRLRMHSPTSTAQVSYHDKSSDRNKRPETILSQKLINMITVRSLILLTSV